MKCLNSKEVGKRIFILVGPSGSGKSTLGLHLKELGIPELISHTTREKRKGEEDGVDYNFVTKEDFDKVGKIEYNRYAGNYYCLSREEVESKLKDNNYVFAITDINGMRQVKAQYPKETVSIFISVTKIEMLERMRARGDSESNTFKRIRNAVESEEFKNSQYCDYVVRNDDLDMAFLRLDRIISKETKDKLRAQ